MNRIEIGEIVNIRGVRGEVKVRPEVNREDFFEQLKAVYLEEEKYAIQSVKYIKNCVALKLSGVDTPEQAMALRGKKLTIPEKDLPKVPANTYYVKDLEGLEVYVDGGRLGILAEVLFTGANDVYLVRAPEGKEYLIPAVKEFITGIDLKEKRMDVRPIRGITYDED